mgnify:FL=1
MASIGFRLKSKENKQVSIYIYFRPANSKVVSARTGQTINPSDWSSSKKKAKTTDPYLINLNTTLTSLEKFISQALNNDQRYGIEINNRWLNNQVDEFSNKVPQNDQSYLIHFLDEVIESLHYKKANDGSQGLKPGTIKGYNTFRGVLMSFEESISLRLKFNNLDENLAEDFLKWMIDEKKYAKSQVGRLMMRLKSLLKEAVLKNIPVSINPEIIGKGFNYKPEKIINVITEEEFIKISQLKDLSESIDNVRKWILIGLMVGQRVSDLLSLNKHQIRFDESSIAMIDVKQAKGGTVVTVPVKNEIVISILKHKFPYRISDQNFNKYMKEVCKKAGLTDVVTGYKFNALSKRKELVEKPKYELLASHDLRRSFATYHYDKGMPVAYIMKITGHKRESTFYEYIGKNPKKDFDAYNFLNAIK